MNPLKKMRADIEKQMTDYVESQLLPICYEVYKFLLPDGFLWATYETFTNLVLERLKGEKN